MKKILTLPPEAFAEACKHLQEACAVRPDLVVGIESGGRYVAELMFADVPHCYVAMRRHTTEHRSALAEKVLQRLPLWVCNALRRIEDARVCQKKVSPVAFEGKIPKEVLGASCILLVDDAVDSGTTLHAVADALQRANPEARLYTAAICQTTKAPLRRPDTSLYTNCLIRFPWSADMKKQPKP